MRKTTWLFGFGVLLLAQPARAQLSLGLAGGLSQPQGDLHDGFNTGWHALGMLALGSPMQPFGIRLDVAYNRFAFNDQLEATLGQSGHLSTGSATLNLSYRFPKATWPVSPYLITGLGAYRTSCSFGPDCGSTVHFGWNFGLGARFRFLGFRSFLEARYHRTGRHGEGVHYFPLTFGILF